MTDKPDISTAAIDIVFDGPPGPEAGRFVEVEEVASGRSINVGEWHHRPDGYWVLRIPDFRAIAAARNVLPRLIAESEEARNEIAWIADTAKQSAGRNTDAYMDLIEDRARRYLDRTK